MSCALNEPAADMTLVDLETGERKQLMDLIAANEGKHTILTFYATWSKACVQEVELMELFSKGDHHKLLNFVLVNLDQNVGATLAFLDTIVEIKGVKKPRVRRFYGDGEKPTVMHFGLADAEVPGPYGLQSVPHTVVINPDGIVLRNGDNFHWDDIAGLLRHRQEMTDPGVLNQLIRWLIPPLTV